VPVAKLGYVPWSATGGAAARGFSDGAGSVPGWREAGRRSAGEEGIWWRKITVGGWRWIRMTRGPREWIRNVEGGTVAAEYYLEGETFYKSLEIYF
jgi:hypothetical protein